MEMSKKGLACDYSSAHSLLAWTASAAPCFLIGAHPWQSPFFSNLIIICCSFGQCFLSPWCFTCCALTSFIEKCVERAKTLRQNGIKPMCQGAGLRMGLAGWLVAQCQPEVCTFTWKWALLLQVLLSNQLWVAPGSVKKLCSKTALQ